MTKKFRVFKQLNVVVEKEIEAKDFDEAYEKMCRTDITNEDLIKGNIGDSCIFAAEDTVTGEYYDYAN